jgi:hypothetical protein
MRLLQGLLLPIALACGVAAYQQSLTRAPLQQSTSPKPQPSTNANSNPNQETNRRFVKQFAERIAERQNEPSEKVFKNIQQFKGVPARQLLVIMNVGYSRALGVSCTHCHVDQDFASDDKRPKRAAREMAVMHRMINEQLAKMQNLKTNPVERAINCSTCHRGDVDPMASER